VLLMVLMSGAKRGATAARSDTPLTVFAQNGFMRYSGANGTRLH